MQTSTVQETKKAVKPKYRGLCSTCKNAATCTFPRDPARPIMHCDEFDGYEGPKTLVKPRVARPETKAEVEFKGLCRNCENRYHCVFPKPAGGVWQCDEYC